MRLTSKGRYAVRAILDLTFNSNGRPVRLQEISERQKISLHYLEQLFRRLRKGSVVKSVRGPGGGYVLARSMDEISIKDVLISVGENINPARDLVGSADVKSDTVEFVLTKSYFENLGLIMQEYLTTTSVGDLIRKARGTQELPKGAAADLGGFSILQPKMSARAAIYLDANATAPLSQAAREAIRKLTDDLIPNPSSVHAHGRVGKRVLAEARERIALSLGSRTDPEQLVLTSSGSESNQLAVRSALEPAFARGEKPHWITTRVEHDSVRQLVPWVRARGGSVTELEVDSDGSLELGRLGEAFRPIRRSSAPSGSITRPAWSLLSNVC